jgi:hypothetical protein
MWTCNPGVADDEPCEDETPHFKDLAQYWSNVMGLPYSPRNSLWITYPSFASEHTLPPGNRSTVSLRLAHGCSSAPTAAGPPLTPNVAINFNRSSLADVSDGNEARRC